MLDFINKQAKRKPKQPLSGFPKHLQCSISTVTWGDFPKTYPAPPGFGFLWPFPELLVLMIGKCAFISSLGSPWGLGAVASSLGECEDEGGLPTAGPKRVPRVPRQTIVLGHHSTNHPAPESFQTLIKHLTHTAKPSGALNKFPLALLQPRGRWGRGEPHGEKNNFWKPAFKKKSGLFVKGVMCQQAVGISALWPSRSSSRAASGKRKNWEKK